LGLILRLFGLSFSLGFASLAEFGHVLIETSADVSLRFDRFLAKLLLVLVALAFSHY
jgi:hypothetical protein